MSKRSRRTQRNVGESERPAIDGGSWVQLRLDADMARRLDAACEVHGATRPGFLRVALLDRLERLESGKIS